MTATLFRYLILINIFVYDILLRLFVSFSFKREDISNTQKSVWQHIKTPPWKLVKTSLLRVIFKTIFSVLETWSNIVFAFDIIINKPLWKQ